MYGSEKNRLDLYVTIQYSLFVLKEWGLYSVEWDPGVEISSVKCEGGSTEGGNNGAWCGANWRVQSISLGWKFGGVGI